MSSQQDQEDLLLEDYSKKISFKSSALFILNSLIVSATPIWLYSQILFLDVNENAVLYGLFTVISAFLIYYSYKNSKFYYKHEIAQKREEAVRKEVNSNTKLSRKEKDDLILSRKIEVADYEATNYSVFHNNAIFLALVVVSYLLFKRLSPSLNYALATSLSSALVALFSTAHQQKK